MPIFHFLPSGFVSPTVCMLPPRSSSAHSTPLSFSAAAALSPAQPFATAPKSISMPSGKAMLFPLSFIFSTPVRASSPAISSSSGTRYSPVVNPHAHSTGYSEMSSAPPVRSCISSAKSISSAVSSDMDISAPPAWSTAYISLFSSVTDHIFSRRDISSFAADMPASPFSPYAVTVM